MPEVLQEHANACLHLRHAPLVSTDCCVWQMVHQGFLHFFWPSSGGGNSQWPSSTSCSACPQHAVLEFASLLTLRHCFAALLPGSHAVMLVLFPVECCGRRCELVFCLQVSLAALLEFAIQNSHVQLILLSPQDVSAVEEAKLLAQQSLPLPNPEIFLKVVQMVHARPGADR